MYPLTEHGGLERHEIGPSPSSGYLYKSWKIVTSSTHMINQDTMSTLISDTLVSRVEPPPFGWVDTILEQTIEYWNSTDVPNLIV